MNKGFGYEKTLSRHKNPEWQENNQKRNKVRYISVLGYICVFLSIYTTHAYATVATNDNWIIQVDDINISSNTTTVSNQNKQPTTSPQNPGSYSGNNYEVIEDFSDPTSGPFSFSVSNYLIDFGILSPTNPIYRTSNLAVSNGNAKQTIVTGYENHPLLAINANTTIPNSTCDNGSCSEITAALWTNTLTYGFGYRCDNVNGNGCLTDFNQNDYFKRFSDYSTNESPQIIMLGNSQGNNETQITYKVNISKTQATGQYMNTITYIASSGY